MATIHKLKDALIRNATCGTGTVRKLADGNGLYLWVMADGAKLWRYRYAVLGVNRKGEPALVERLMSVGVYPRVSLAEARVEAAKLRQQSDPAALRKAGKQAASANKANTFEDVAKSWLAKQKHWNPKYANDLTVLLARYAFPLLGARPVSELESPDVLAVLERIEATGAVSTAHRMLPIFDRIFRYAKGKGLCQHVASADISAKDALQKPVTKKMPAVKPDELPKLLRAINAYGGDRRTTLALKLAALTFVRANELLGATWDEIDLDKALWRIPESRMKKRLALLVPLAPQAVAILRELKEISCGSHWIFPGHNYEKPLTSNALLAAFRRMGYAGAQTTHGLRRIASTTINEACDAEGRPLFHADAIERQLSHFKEDVRGTYNEAEYLLQRKKIMCWWADYLDETTKKGVNE